MAKHSNRRSWTVAYIIIPIIAIIVSIFALINSYEANKIAHKLNIPIITVHAGVDRSKDEPTQTLTIKNGGGPLHDFDYWVYLFLQVDPPYRDTVVVLPIAADIRPRGLSIRLGAVALPPDYPGRSILPVADPTAQKQTQQV